MSDEEGQGVPEAQEKEEEPKFFLDVILSRQINMKKVPQERAAKQREGEDPCAWFRLGFSVEAARTLTGDTLQQKVYGTIPETVPLRQLAFDALAGKQSVAISQWYDQKEPLQMRVAAQGAWDVLPHDQDAPIGGLLWGASLGEGGAVSETGKLEEEDDEGGAIVRKPGGAEQGQASKVDGRPVDGGKGKAVESSDDEEEARVREEGEMFDTLRDILAGADLREFNKKQARRQLEVALGKGEGSLEEMKRQIGEWVDTLMQEYKEGGWGGGGSTQGGGEGGGGGSRVDKDGGLQGKVGGGAGDIGKSAARSGDDDDDSGEDGEVPARRLFE